MEFGVQMIFQSYGYGESVDDRQVVAEEIRLGLLAEAFGFDKLCGVVPFRWPLFGA